MNLRAIICVLYLIISTNEAAFCPKGYKALGNNATKNCYKIVDVPMKWNSARENCTRDGHHLVSLEEREEVKWLRGKIIGRWTSAHYTRHGGWKWYNEDKTDLRAWDWQNHTPNHPLYCATVGTNTWLSNFPCAYWKPFICEAKPGCRIALFQETYPHLTLKKVYDDVIFRGTIHVSCDLEKGWRGQGEATCLGTNHWRVPTCSKIQCSSPRPIDHQAEGSSPENKSMYSKGEEYQYQCKPGYEINSDVIFPRCTVNETWSYTNAECQPVSCEVPQIRNGRHDRVNGVKFGETVTFYCNNGYHPLGAKSCRCMEDRFLSPNVPSCEVNACPMLVVDEDVVVEDTIRSDNQSQYVYGDVVHFSCIKGFELDGSSSTICKADGRWTSIPPTCHPKPCASLPTPRHGSKYVTALHFGGRAVFRCYPGFIIEGSTTSDCLKDGTWSNVPPVCKACPIGTYYSRNGLQASCIDCPERSTTVVSASHSILQCTCEKGTEGPPGGPCIDINECTIANCSQGCVNTEGSYECTCTIPGYVLADDGRTCIRYCDRPGFHGKHLCQIWQTWCSGEEPQTCPALEDRPGHGYVRCQNIEEENSKICFIGCEPGYFFVSGQNNYLTCGPSTGFVWSHKRANHKAVLPSCTRKFYVDAMFPISVTLNNTEEVCQSLSGKEVEELMWNHLRSLIDNQGTCRGNDSNSGLCEAANFTVSCNGEQKEIKMDSDLVVRNYDSAPINSNYTRCGSNCGRSNLRQMLRRTVTNKNAVSTNLTREFTVDINGTEITLSPNNPVEGKIKLMCAEPGRVFTNELCVPCDKGYYLPSPWMPNCVPGPRGYFQALQGQTSCGKCREGSTTMGEGSTHPRMCNVRLHQRFTNP